MTTVDVPTLSTRIKPVSASLRTLSEQLDGLMASTWVRSSAVMPLGLAATACNSRIRIGSARHANHFAYVAASPDGSNGPCERGVAMGLIIDNGWSTLVDEVTLLCAKFEGVGD